LRVCIETLIEEDKIKILPINLTQEEQILEYLKKNIGGIESLWRLNLNLIMQYMSEYL